MNDTVKVIDLIKEQVLTHPEYPDEAIASTMHLVSLARRLRAIEKTSPEYIKGNKLDMTQDWLVNQSEKIRSTYALNFDRITELVGHDLNSCDALLYWFNGEKLSYLIEFKASSKSTLLEYLKTDTHNDNDQILEKINGSKKIIVRSIELSGVLEHEELIKKLHCVIVYHGKNDIPVSSSVAGTLPRRGIAKKDARNHQCKATKGNKKHVSTKNEEIEVFSKEVQKLGFSSASEDEFPGKALPKVTKFGRGKVRFVSIMSSQDFLEMVDNGFFDNWDWGLYKEFFAQTIKSLPCDLTKHSE